MVERSKKYNQKNREERIAYQRAYYKKNREKLLQDKKNQYQELKKLKESGETTGE